MPGYEGITQELKTIYPDAVIETIANVTEGQACTALIGLESLEQQRGNSLGPITFGACDNGVLSDQVRLEKLLKDPDIDVIVWGVRGHANAARHPKMFGWIDEENGNIKQVSVKTPLGNPESDPIILGTFTFRKAEDFHKVVERLIARGGQINGEYYIDSCITDALELGLNCHLFEVDHFLCWGTPNDLRTFEYWQSCFHKWSGHPYRLEQDGRVLSDVLPELEASYRAIVPELPGSYE
jgi:hypothetical protein